MKALFASVLLVCGSAPLWAAECTCAAARAGGGWCLVHHVGYLGGVEVRSEMLFEQMDAHGHQADMRHLACPGCDRALATDGYCPVHKVGFVKGLAYFSKLTHLLALGKLLPDAEIKCPVCRRNAESHGWCPSCKVGMAGHIAIKDPQSFQEVERALHVLELANEAAKRCEDCAVAIVIDAQCPLCRITYKDGKPIE